uniref:Uncharacterized protein n=1 Tax=Arundo donax TaxID=35708 RepID=A0A0A8ZYG1_ARUDO
MKTSPVDQCMNSVMQALTCLAGRHAIEHHS